LLGDGAVAVESLTSSSDIFVTSGGLADVGTANAGRDLLVNAQSIALANGTAGRDIRLLGSDAITVTTAQAGDDFIARSSNGTASIGAVATTGLGEDAIEAGYGSIAGDGSNIRITAAGRCPARQWRRGERDFCALRRGFGTERRAATGRQPVGISGSGHWAQRRHCR
jgi:hypothetical protein